MSFKHSWMNYFYRPKVKRIKYFRNINPVNFIAGNANINIKLQF